MKENVRIKSYIFRSKNRSKASCSVFCSLSGNRFNLFKRNRRLICAKLYIYYYFISLAQCAMGQTKNAESGLCECSYCGTSADCTKDADGDNLNRCTCNEGYEPDTTLTTGTHYYCEDQQCKNRL